jgi:hypothetical protein
MIRRKVNALSGSLRNACRPRLRWLRTRNHGERSPLSPYPILEQREVQTGERFAGKATARFTTFVYGLARRRMWLVARAAFYGLSPEQMHRMDAAKRTALSSLLLSLLDPFALVGRLILGRE